MTSEMTRRSLVGTGLPISAAALLGLSARAQAAPDTPAPYAAFPSQDPARVRDTVLYAHSDVDKVRALVEASPALANAAIDWGFGDWESALGAASHMGRRDIAAVLLEHGARPDLFTHAMLGNLAALEAMVAALPGVQRIAGPHGLTLLHHARMGGDASKPVLAYLESLGDADPVQTSAPLELPVDAYLGTYSFGPGEDERFEIVAQGGLLGLRRGSGFPRTLLHLGGHEFHPGGARSVRVRFEVASGRAVRVRIYDPELLVEGARV